jgi:flavin-dependent dehydrogenase
VTFANRETDVFVVGGGPAGLAAAIAARRKGFSVTLADGAKPPIDKPCGEGMMPETRAALRALGVTIPAGEGYAFRGIQFVAATARVAADFPEGRGIGIRRPILHGLLLREAERLGVNFLWKTPVRGIAANQLHLAQGTFATKWIIGADGSTSRVRRWSGLEAVVRRAQRSAVRRHYCVGPWSEFMEIHWGPRAQAYVTPISGEEVCIVMMAEKAGDVEFERALEEMPELRERLAGAELSSRGRGAITSMCSLRRVSRGNVALVGDASGGVDAITGEGLRLSFRQAQELAEAMALNDLGRYESAHRKLARRPMWIGQLMLQLGKNVWLRERAMRAMQNQPEIFARMLAVHVGRATAGNVVAAGAQLGWEFLSA